MIGVILNYIFKNLPILYPCQYRLFDQCLASHGALKIRIFKIQNTYVNVNFTFT